MGYNHFGQYDVVVFREYDVQAKISSKAESIKSGKEVIVYSKLPKRYSNFRILGFVCFMLFEKFVQFLKEVSHKINNQDHTVLSQNYTSQLPSSLKELNVQILRKKVCMCFNRTTT